MDTDDAKQAWQAQPSLPRPETDSDSIIKEVRRGQRAFAATIFWRDVREIGTCAVLVPIWITVGIRSPMPWTWFLAVPAMLWVAGYMLVDRLRQRRNTIDPAAPLSRHVEHSLAEVEHQIGMLRSVFWWYLLPLTLAMFAFVGQIIWELRKFGWPAAVVAALAFGIIAGVMAAVYWLNQYAVRAGLEPRRRELLALRASLAEETPEAR